MAKVILEFDAETEKSLYKVHLAALDYQAALQDFESRLKDVVEYGFEGKEAPEGVPNEVCQKVAEALKTLFYGVLKDNDVTLYE